MSDYDYQLAVMDDDGWGCAITTDPAERVTHLIPATFWDRDTLRCCGRDVHDVPGSDRITNREDAITCAGVA
jgi:hypothetical protein